MRAILISVLFFNLTLLIQAQTKVESDIETALVNAKKGVYWALSNLQGKKAKIDKLIINDDKLISKVKVSKEVNGVKIESTGYFQTNEVNIVLYKSSDTLIKDGYIKKGELEIYNEEDY
ncbi:MAG TPA: hypothetical protein PK073_07730 [Ignavibacteriaceae bacterium]|jgi:hypothetical protein|nr:MAG: hypothetical protein BWY38_00362 [Ignavibacteria bacterium ADurb.Bin266]HQF42790.1 hypothetical protein [Ignavibacteriaceae bacterium]HQI39503.1 hypothetical protein [Ignavibacteriaceae bacterium]HQJ44989.1 hypothetical protein [Ignavibacteriaceae bacterium]